MSDAPAPRHTFTVDLLRCEVYPTREAMGVAAGRAVATTIRTALARQRECRIVLAAAPSQDEFLAELAAARGVDWQRVTAFHLDEYVGLGATAPQSFGRYLAAHLFERVRPGAVHYLNGLADDPSAECLRYAALLRQAPLDLLCDGIGENGHLAFNDPGTADFADPLTVKVVALELASREQQVRDGCFPTLAAVPTHAFTLTIPTVMSARRLFCIVPGPTKTRAVGAVLTESITPAWPSSILRRHPAAVLYGDLAALTLALGSRGLG
jgi:glucosamine-6-phosphate deaminase